MVGADGSFSSVKLRFACQKRVFQLLHPINQLIAIGKVGWQRAVFAGFASQQYVGPIVTDPSSK